MPPVPGTQHQMLETAQRPFPAFIIKLHQQRQDHPLLREGTEVAETAEDPYA